MLTHAKTMVQSSLGSIGYRLVKVPKPGTVGRTAPYEELHPTATYAPWRADNEFLSAMALIEGHTLVDMYRCWEIWSLVNQTAKLSGSLIEIGVWRGGTGALIAKRASLSQIPDPVFLCDTFSGVVKAGDEDAHYKGGEHSDTSQALVEQLISVKFGLKNVRILQGIFPDDSAHLIAPEHARFRFCHIDVDVYNSAKEIVNWIWDRMVPGGVIVYDDYGFYGCDGITKFVNEQIPQKDRMVFHNLNGHAVIVKLDAPRQ